jgi:hypothetical protein
MCKLLGFTVEEKVAREKLNDIIFTAKELLKDQKDGFGYALSGGEVGGIASLRLTTGHYLGYGFDPAGEFSGNVIVPYERRGDVVPCTAGIFHGRTSTNHVKIENCHPFVNDNLALIHNGIVEYSGKRRKKQGTCDSEDLFNTFAIGKGWRELSRHYYGYAAIMMLKPGGILTIYRDATPQLYICKVRGGIVVGTSMLDVTTLARKFGEPSAPWQVMADIALTCLNGHKVGHQNVKPMPRKAFGASDQLSLGYGIKTKSPALVEDNTATPFPDYDKKPEYKTSGFWEGSEAGYEDGLAGKAKQFLGESVDRDYCEGYAEGYEEGRGEMGAVYQA